MADTSNTSTRRQFVGTAASLGTAVFLGGTLRPARGANEKLGIGVIGCGGRGNTHMQVWNHMATHGDNVEIVAVCDIYRPRLARAATTYKAKGYMDHRELVADPRVDIVSIATPDHHHGYQTIDAVRAGKAVYCEKPFTHWRQFDLLKRTVAAVKESKQAFQIGTQAMSDSAWHQMRKLVVDGLIGPPIHAECGYFRVGDWGERGMPIDDPNARPGKDLDWQAFLGDAPKRPFDVSRFFRWRMYEDYAGGPVTDLLPHSFSPVCHVLGVTMPSIVVATGGKFRYQEREVPDTFNMLIDYPEKITVAVLGTQGNDYVEASRGAAGRMPVIRGWDGTLTIERKTNRIVFIPSQGSKKKRQYFDIEHGEDMVRFFRDLVAAHRQGRRDTLAPIDLAYHVQTAMIMGMWAFREQTAARFDRATEQILM